MDAVANTLVPVAAGGGNFLVTPHVGLMIWTLIAFSVTLLTLRRLAFPRIQEALERRRLRIEESVTRAEQRRREARGLIQEALQEVDFSVIASGNGHG